MTASLAGTISTALLSSGVIQQQAQHLASRRIRARKEVERVVPAEPREFYLVAELRDLFPGAIRAEQVMGKVSAVPVRHCSEDMFAVRCDASSLISAMRGKSLPIE